MRRSTCGSRTGTTNACRFRRPGGSGRRSVGFRYTKGASPGAAGIVVIKKESFSGDFLLKLKLTGAGDPITVVPMPSVTGFAATFTIGGGDQYCAGGATPTGSVVTDRVYRVKQVGAPVACDLAACSPGGAFLD